MIGGNLGAAVQMLKVINQQGGGSQSWESYWATHLYNESDLLLNFNSRLGNELIDSVSAEKAKILVEGYKRYGTAYLKGDKARSSELLLDGGSYTVYLKIEQRVQITTGSSGTFILLGGGTVNTRRGMLIRYESDRVRFYTCDGTNYLRNYLTDAGLNAITWGNGVFEIIAQINGTAKTLVANMYNSNGDSIGTPISQDLSSLVFNSDQNYTFYALEPSFYVVGAIKKYSGIKTITQCRDDSYLTDLQIHIPNPSIGGAIDISGNDQHMTSILPNDSCIYYNEISSWVLDYGFDMYRKIDESIYPIISPKTYAGTSIACPLAATWKTQDSDGGLGILNMASCKIRFTNNFFDRSNATIWNDACRAATDYDTTNVKDFNISSLNQKTLTSWLNVGYRGRLYVKMTPNSVEDNQGGTAYMRDALKLDNILLYTNDQTGEANRNILAYTKDISCAIFSGSEPTYMDNYVNIGTLKTSIPMFTIRLDDGAADIMTSWRDFFAARNVSPSVNVHSQLVGTAGYATWAELVILQSEGWEITSSGINQDDWGGSGVTEAQVETGVSISKTEIEAQGLICNHLIPNKYGQGNLASRYFAKKYGYVTCHCGYTYGSVNGTNPQIIDKYNLCAMACDIGSDYNLADLPNATAIQNVKDQLDLCVSGNRWAIMYMHGYGVNLAAAVSECIAYAQSIGITNVTMDEAIANSKYL